MLHALPPSYRRRALAQVEALIAQAERDLARHQPTRTGEAEYEPAAAKPFPSWPEASLPQHAAPPVSRTAHECARPAPTCAAFVRPATAVGTRRLDPVEPSPIWPSRSSPQQTTPLVARTAHVCEWPAEICVASVKPMAKTGVVA